MTRPLLPPDPAEIDRLRDENAELLIRCMELEAENRELLRERAWNNGGISE